MFNVNEFHSSEVHKKRVKFHVLLKVALMLAQLGIFESALYMIKVNKLLCIT